MGMAKVVEGMKRVQFEFTDEAYDAIETLAVRTGKPSLAAVLGDALRLYDWVISEQAAGCKIISLNPKTTETQELPLIVVSGSAGEVAAEFSLHKPGWRK